MPIIFLTDEQQQHYSRCVGELTAKQLAYYFHLDDADRELIIVLRGDHDRLSFTLQLGTVSYLGIFLVKPIETPLGVVAYAARQLGIADLAWFAQYCVGKQRWEHEAEIRRRYGSRTSPVGLCCGGSTAGSMFPAGVERIGRASSLTARLLG